MNLATETMPQKNAKGKWKWDGQSVMDLYDKCLSGHINPEKFQEWPQTIANELKEPITTIELGKSKKVYEMARLLAVDLDGMAMLRIACATSKSGYAYSIMTLNEAEKFMGKCRQQFIRHGRKN